jgi:ribose-phosphate pyrophosphokinase
MITLNLTDQEKSCIKYKISKFPDGQQQITINPFKYSQAWNGWTFATGPNIIQSITGLTIEIQIKSRLNNFQDLELIICALKSLRELGVKKIHLYTPYFLGSRSDRKFEGGSCNYLKDVICPIINSLNFESITVLDPHSHVLEACINNFKKMDNFMLTAWVMNLQLKDYNFKNSILVSPDAGASHKIYKLAEQIGYIGDIITCSKERDKDGKLTKCIVPLKIEMANKDYIIIDDIIDGGQTFINIAKELKSKPLKGKIYLIVTHGIFSKGFAELSQYFDGIYCTNSYSDIENLVGGAYTKNFKQLNIF